MRHQKPEYDANVQDKSGKIPANEPVFLLRGQDVLAPAVVRYWVKKYRERGGSEEKARKVLAWADEMELWGPRKLPD